MLIKFTKEVSDKISFPIDFFLNCGNDEFITCLAGKFCLKQRLETCLVAFIINILQLSMKTLESSVSDAPNCGVMFTIVIDDTS